MLGLLKGIIYVLASAVGYTTLVGATNWRRNRLAILGYHGIALHDEQYWNPGLYITERLFRRRLEAIRSSGCTVLALGEALDRLRDGTLPPRSVVITFDDGYFDFYAKAAPILREYGAPATVYVSSYYSFFNRPVFDTMLSYLLWKGADQTLSWPEVLGDGMP